MKIGNLLIYITTIIAIIGFMFMFGMGLFYMEHTTLYAVVGIITILSAAIDFTLMQIKNEI